MILAVKTSEMPQKSSNKDVNFVGEIQKVDNAKLKVDSSIIVCICWGKLICQKQHKNACIYVLCSCSIGNDDTMCLAIHMSEA